MMDYSQLILSGCAIVFATITARLFFDVLERGWQNDDDDKTDS
jgi:hypothetical protein